MMCDSCVATPVCPDLLDGIAVFIDDEINDAFSSAGKLKQQIEEKNIPLIARDKIPDNISDFIKHLYGVSFIILDWKFSQITDPQIAEEVHLPDDVNSGATVEMLKGLLTATYCPIFILSQEDVATIKRELDELKITSNGMHPRIFVNSKNDLLDGKLFSSLNEWIDKEPVTYVLKTWENAAKEAKLGMFSHLEKKNNSWPKILWKSFENDDADPAVELTHTLSTIFANRLQFSCSFVPSHFTEGTNGGVKNDIRNVLEEARFLPVQTNTKPAPGDLFEHTENGQTVYFLNFRAQCSTLHDPKPKLYCVKGVPFDDTSIYCVQGKVLAEDTLGKNADIVFCQGEFRTKKHIILLPFVHGNKILQFDCRKIEILKFKQEDASLYTSITYKDPDLKGKDKDKTITIQKGSRIGRVLPPYINHIQQIISSYIVREGLPAIPDEAIAVSTPPPSPSGETGE